MLAINRKFYLKKKLQQLKWAAFVRDKSNEKCAKPFLKILTLYKNIKITKINGNY